jgi:hypothetical protein
MVEQAFSNGFKYLIKVGPSKNEMYKIAWLQFVIKIFCQEMHQLQKLDRCEDSVELLGLFESSARNSVTESCSRWLTTIS